MLKCFSKSEQSIHVKAYQVCSSLAPYPKASFLQPRDAHVPMAVKLDVRESPKGGCCLFFLHLPTVAACAVLIGSDAGQLLSLLASCPTYRIWVSYFDPLFFIFSSLTPLIVLRNLQQYLLRLPIHCNNFSVTSLFCFVISVGSGVFFYPWLKSLRLCLFSFLLFQQNF